MPSKCARVLGIAVHDLRTPLAVVSGYLGLMIRQQSDTLSPRQRELLGSMERATTSLTTLVGELGELANFESHALRMKREAVKLPSLMKQVCAQFARDKSGTISLGTIPVSTVVGDEPRLRAAFHTLIAGAVRELPAQQTVTVQSVLKAARASRSVLVGIGGKSHVEQLLRVPRSRLAAFDGPDGARNLAGVIACRILEAHGGKVWMLRGRHDGPGVLVELPAPKRANKKGGVKKS